MRLRRKFGTVHLRRKFGIRRKCYFSEATAEALYRGEGYLSEGEAQCAFGVNSDFESKKITDKSKDIPDKPKLIPLKRFYQEYLQKRAEVPVSLLLFFLL